MAEPDDAGAVQAALRLVISAVRDGQAVPGDNAADPVAALTALRRIRDQLDRWEPQLIAAARAGGSSWGDLAPALGVASRQAAERRYLRVRRADRDGVGGTREERVDAERDRRAGQRAISDWARANGADLRQLAGQITALIDLGPAAQPSLDRLHDALGGADPVPLLPLLRDTHEHLPARHAALADRISAIAERADEIRRSTEQRRDHARRSSGPGER